MSNVCLFAFARASNQIFCVPFRCRDFVSDATELIHPLYSLAILGRIWSVVMIFLRALLRKLREEVLLRKGSSPLVAFLVHLEAFSFQVVRLLTCLQRTHSTYVAVPSPCDSRVPTKIESRSSINTDNQDQLSQRIAFHFCKVFTSCLGTIVSLNQPQKKCITKIPVSQIFW